MKFKTKEELIDENTFKSQGSPIEQIQVIEDNKFVEGINLAFKSFVERMNFYEKYRCLRMWKGGYNEHLNKMKDECEEVYDLYWKYNEEIGNDLKKYKNWNTFLFDYCFRDLIK